VKALYAAFVLLGFVVGIRRRGRGELLAWTQDWAMHAQRPFLYQSGGEWYAFGPAEFQQEMLAKMERGEKLW
jgi:hypothetical protein